MIVPFGHDAAEKQLAVAIRELEICNAAIGRHGLALSTTDIQALVTGRIEALDETERVEFGSGIAKDLVLGFAGSPFVAQTTFTQTLIDLQALFYEFKNESMEQITDEDLIQSMRSLYDDVANGDMERLAAALFDGLGRHVRELPPIDAAVQDYAGDAAYAAADDAADPESDNAAMNGYKLAAHRYDISKWVDEDYSPAWDGASWLDE